jgi:serine/threonine protein kinase
LATNPAVGDILASKFRLEALLGAGGMGCVFRAVNLEIGREVAIKVMRPEFAAQPAMVERFIREARAANLVRHPNVVDILDIGRDRDGCPFIVQELLKGEDLDAYLQRRGGRLRPEEIAELILPIVDALGLAHANGVVHRDIKPSNIFLAQQVSGRIPKLLDFGISKITLQTMRATVSGVIGTPAYMAPEQIRGDGRADARTDVWALGVMLFELLGGRLPFEGGDSPQIFVEIATSTPPRLQDIVEGVSPQLSRVVERCLRKSPDARYPSATEVARDLDHVVRAEAIEPTQQRSLLALEFAPRRSEPSIPKAVDPSSSMSKARLGRPTEIELAADSAAGLALQLDDDATSRRRLVAARPAVAPREFSKVTGGQSGGSPVTFFVALSAVVVTTVATAATLTATVGRTEGLSLISGEGDASAKLFVHAGLAFLALLLSALLGFRGVRAWSRVNEPSVVSALAQAITSGAFLFAALQLFRATW